MTNIELYINETLCEILNPKNLGIRLNRVLINPAELQMKDAQYSYSITVPSSSVNDAIFRYINIEETKNKFNHNHTAQVYVDSVLVFDGLFKLSEIDSDGNYKGNLVVPTPKTVKEIFGDKKMNQVPQWKLYLTADGTETGEPMGMVEMLNSLNARKGIKEAIFPLVLYGLLPKVAKDDEGNYSDKEVWDNTVRIGAEDFPPSINCLEAIRHIFESSTRQDGTHYQIGGSAFSDPKLAHLYMSYCNPSDYEQPWNWAHLGKLHIKGSWNSAVDKGLNSDDNTGGLANLEVKMIGSESKEYKDNGEEETKPFNVADLFSAGNTRVEVIEDNGYNIFQNKSKQGEDEIQNTNIRIPASGMYKIKLKASVELMGTDKNRIATQTSGGVSGLLKFRDLAYNKNGVRFVYSNANDSVGSFHGIKIFQNWFQNLRAEVKLLRTRDADELDLTEQGIDGLFFRGNMKQLNDLNSQKDEQGRQKFNTYPKYFPKPESVLWVDPYQNRNFICGLHWGKRGAANPVDSREAPCYRMAAKSGISWSIDNDDVNYCVANSASYWSYKPLTSANIVQEEEGETDVSELGYVDEGKLRMILNNTGEKEDYIAIQEPTNNNLNQIGDGGVCVVMWLDRGDSLKLIDVTDVASCFGDYQANTCVAHKVDFELSLEPYKQSTNWAMVKMDGTGLKNEKEEGMNWDEESDFGRTYIDLAKFLPSDQKVDEWLDNFCKAFNLDLLQPRDGTFELNTKRRKYTASVGSLLDLSDKTDLRRRSNQALELPSQIDVSFKINQEEEGYASQMREDPENPNKVIPAVPDSGDGTIYTGSIDGKPIAQTSSFSYTWYKKIDCRYFLGEGNGREKISFPVIANKEVWEQPRERGDYAEMQKKTYTSYGQRFWYPGSEVYNMGALWKDRYIDSSAQFAARYSELSLYPVQGDSSAVTADSDYLILTYKDEPKSLLRTYFTLISTDDSNYTQLECYLSPDEYERLSAGILVSLNSDLYYVASIESYDPLGQNLTKLKLIRKI